MLPEDQPRKMKRSLVSQIIRIKKVPQHLDCRGTFDIYFEMI